MPELTTQQAGLAPVTAITRGQRLAAVREVVQRHAARYPITENARERAVAVAECVFASTGYADKAIRAGKRYVRHAVEKGGTGITPTPQPA